MFASTSYCTVARPAHCEALSGDVPFRSGFRGEQKMSSAGFMCGGDCAALKSNVSPKPTAARTKSSGLDISAILAERPLEALVSSLTIPLVPCAC